MRAALSAPPPKTFCPSYHNISVYCLSHSEVLGGTHGTPTTTQHRSLMLEHGSPLRVAIAIHLPYPDLLVPTRRGEVFGGWAEADVGDAVVRRVAHRDIVLEIALRGIGGGGAGLLAEEGTHGGGWGSWGQGSALGSGVSRSAGVRHLRWRVGIGGERVDLQSLLSAHE